MTRLAIVASTLALMSGAATAQSSTGTNTRGRTASPVYSDGAVDQGTMLVKANLEALRAGRKTAACAAGTRSNSVTSVLASTDEKQWAAALKKLQGSLGLCLVNATGGESMATEMQFSKFDMFGLLSEALLVRSAVPSLAPVAVAGVPRAPQWLAKNEGQAVTLQVATCLAHTQPQPSLAIVWSKPETAQEGLAFAKLVPYLATCVDKNMTLKASKAVLRLALATALYQRKLHPHIIIDGAPAADGSR